MSEATTNTAPTSEALREIRDGRLYRTQFGTFEEYCQLRWGFTPQHSNRLVMAARVVKAIEMEPIGSITPQTESQARELTRLVEAAAEVVTAIGMTPIGVIPIAVTTSAAASTRRVSSRACDSVCGVMEPIGSISIALTTLAAITRRLLCCGVNPHRSWQYSSKVPNCVRYNRPSRISRSASLVGAVLVVASLTVSFCGSVMSAAASCC